MKKLLKPDSDVPEVPLVSRIYAPLLQP